MVCPMQSYRVVQNVNCCFSFAPFDLRLWIFFVALNLHQEAKVTSLALKYWLWPSKHSLFPKPEKIRKPLDCRF